jgi:hypothetical protein
LEVGIVEGNVFGVEERADGEVDWLVDVAGHDVVFYFCAWIERLSGVELLEFTR